MVNVFYHALFTSLRRYYPDQVIRVIHKDFSAVAPPVANSDCNNEYE